MEPKLLTQSDLSRSDATLLQSKERIVVSSNSNIRKFLPKHVHKVSSLRQFDI